MLSRVAANFYRIHRSSRLATNFPKFPQPPRHCLTRPATCPQGVHCDDDPLDPVYQRGSEDSALCSGILALEAGTSLLLYPSGPEGAALPVLLDAGDLLLFRGDCWHAGAGYACLNRRIHFYLSAPGRRREPGYTIGTLRLRHLQSPWPKESRRGQDAAYGFMM